MRLSTYRRAMRGELRGLRGPKQRRMLRLRAAMVYRRPSRKRAYRRAARLGTFAMVGVGMLGVMLVLGRPARRTAP